MSIRSLNGLSGTTININSFSAGTCLDLTTNTSNPILNFDINKATLTTSNSSTDMFVYKDSSGNTKRINYNDLISSSGLGLTANNALTITNSIINLDINKQTSKTSASTDDEFVLEDNAGNIKKITYSNLISGVDISTATNIGTSAIGSITLGNSSQSLALNSSSMNCISQGKNFFRSNLSTGLSYEVQGYNSSSPAYHSVLQIHNVSSGFPYLSFLLGSGFQPSQYANKNLVIDSNEKIDVANLSQNLGGGIGISIDSTPDINIDFSQLSTATQMFSNNEFIIFSDSDSLYKHITFQNVLNSIDLSPAFNFGTASSFPVNIGNANNQTLTLQGSLININGSNTIKNRSTVSTGVGFQVDGFNSADSIYYSSLKLDNSSVSGIRPTVELLGSNGFYGSAGQVLKKDANNKINWESSTTTTPIQYVATTSDVIALTNTSVDGAVAISASPRKLWLKSTVSGSAIWSSIDFIEQTTTLTSASGLINNTGSAQVFTSSPIGISLANQNDTFNITLVVEDDYLPAITYPTDTTAFTTTNKSVSSSGTTHTFTAIVNNLLTTFSAPSYTIILTDQNTSTIVNLPTITFTLNNPPYSAPNFTASNRSIQGFPTSYSSSDVGGATRSNSLGRIFNDRSYTFYSFNSGSFHNHSQMFGDGRTCAHDSFFGSSTWNFTLSSAQNYLYHASVVAQTPANYTDGGVSKGWTQVVFNSTSWNGYNNNANCFRSVDPLTPGNAISASPGIARGAMFVAAKNV